ncbi:YitT family protein [Butyrivibrio sp. NC3005]|uniref:YitT family protein n=1 Tax=Butyrivibrio sp. NC3005 TaxID=1280685 RepID=UPI000409EB5A|nr:YitT family protein [Butyrivibrio sp. NC3005]
MLTRKKLTKLLYNYALITVGALLYGIGTAVFSDPNNLAPGGFTGIAIVLNRIVNIGTGKWFMILNIPVLVIGTWKFGFHFIVSTLYATGLISVFTDFIAHNLQQYFVTDMMLAVAFGGFFMAAGIGLIFRAGSTSGGSDIIIKLLRIRYPHIKTGMMLFITDLIIIFFAGIVMRDSNAVLYSVLVVLVTGWVLDFVLYGRDEAKLLYIISDRNELITERFLKELDVGVTNIYGQGAYSRTDKKVIMCVMKKRISPLAEEIVRQEDPDAFMIITSASEIFGEGYKNYFEDKI